MGDFDNIDLKPRLRYRILVNIFVWGLGAFAVVALVWGLFTMCNSCYDADTSQEVLRKAGYTEIEIQEGKSWFECGSGDMYATSFTATNPVGVRVKGTVCCGWMMKGCTIRF